MGAALVSGCLVSVREQIVQNAKLDWRHCQGGFGSRMLINGKKVFAISRSSQIERGMPRFLKIIKRQMDIAWGSGFVFSEERKTTYHWSAKHGWKYCPAGVGILVQYGGRKDF